MAGLQDKLFALNYKKGLETLRQRHIEAIVRERFTIVGELSRLSWHSHILISSHRTAPFFVDETCDCMQPWVTRS